MNESREGQLPAVSAWQLEFARLIAFPASPPFVLDQNWWKDLASEQPEDFVSTRTKNVREDRGSFQAVILTLRVDLSQVEWLIQPAVEFDESIGELPTIGLLQEKVDWFVGLLSPWLADSCPPLRRLAFSGKLLQAAATQQEAYQVLAAHLPAVSFDPNPNDFVLQINRRRYSTVVRDLPLNRMSTWSKLSFALSVESDVGTSFDWLEKCYSAVELDMNTAPEWSGILPNQHLPQLFHELASLGIEIATRGDIL